MSSIGQGGLVEKGVCVPSSGVDLLVWSKIGLHSGAWLQRTESWSRGQIPAIESDPKTQVRRASVRHCKSQPTSVPFNL